MLVPFSSRGPLRKHWHPVALSEDVGEKPLAIELIRDRIVLWRGASGHAVAAPDVCTHRPSDLSPGGVRDGCLVCPHHGRAFDETGRCVAAPLAEEVDETPPLGMLQCEERHGLVWVCLGDPAGTVPDPLADGGAACVTAALGTWKTPAPRIVESLLTHGLADGTTQGSAAPFTYLRTVTTGSGDAQVLVTAGPKGATDSFVFVAAVAADDATATAALEAEVAALDAVKAEVTAVTGMYDLADDVAGDDALAQWQNSLRAALSA